MDPNFHESSHNNNNGTSTPAAQFASHSQTPNPLASTPYFSDPSTAAHHQNVGGQGAGGAASGYAQSVAFGDNSSGMAAQAQDNSSIQNFSAQQHQQSRAASSSDAAQAHTQTPGQDSYSAYPYAHDNAYAAQHASAQSVPGATNVDVQALLDSLTPSVHNVPAGQYAAPHLSPHAAQLQPNASTASLSGVPNLPARPPAQEHLATHPNYNPTDDIRSFHPHSQQSPTTQQHSSNGQTQLLSAPGQTYGAARQGGPQSPTTSKVQKRQSGQRSETPDDEDIRWPPEVNRKYEEFLDQERKFVTEGQWDQFPMGSRLFIGMPTSRRD
jgi:hypothetical protein